MLQSVNMSFNNTDINQEMLQSRLNSMRIKKEMPQSTQFYESRNVAK